MRKWERIIAAGAGLYCAFNAAIDFGAAIEAGKTTTEMSYQTPVREQLAADQDHALHDAEKYLGGLGVLGVITGTYVIFDRRKPTEEERNHAK